MKNKNHIMKARITSTELICLVIEKKAYSSDNAILPIIKYIISNAILEAKIELLKPTLKLIKLILSLSRPSITLARSENTLSVLELLKHPDTQVVSDSLDIIKKVITIQSPTNEIIAQYCNKFNIIVGLNDDSLTLKYLYHMGIFVRTPETFVQFIKAEENIKGFEICLSSNNKSVLAYAFQLVFAFLSNQSSMNAFTTLTPSIVTHLSSENKGIAAIAASCLTVIIMNKQGEFDETVFVPETTKFIGESFAIPELRQCGLRLAGVISMTFAGARFLDASDIMPLITNLLLSENTVTRKLAYMAYASFTTSFPLSKNVLSSVPNFVSALEDQDVQPYPLLCITSITEVPGGPAACIDSLLQLSNLFDANDDETITKVFTALINIFSDTSIAEGLDNPKVIKEIFEKTKRFWESPVFMDFSFELIETISLLHKGRAILRKYEVTKFAIENIDNPKYKSVRRHFLKIISRTKALDKQ